MGDVLPFKRPERKVRPHDWGPSRLNHGNFQCRRCGCTDLEALYELGQECKK